MYPIFVIVILIRRFARCRTGKVFAVSPMPCHKYSDQITSDTIAAGGAIFATDVTSSANHFTI